MVTVLVALAVLVMGLAVLVMGLVALAVLMVLVALMMVMALGLGLLTMVMALAVLVALVMMVLGLGLLTMVMALAVLVMALGLGLLVMIRTGSPRLLRAEPFRALVAPKMVMGQVGVLRVKEETTASVASTPLGHPQSVMGPLAKVCPRLLPVSRWTLTIYL